MPDNQAHTNLLRALVTLIICCSMSAVFISQTPHSPRWDQSTLINSHSYPAIHSGLTSQLLVRPISIHGAADQTLLNTQVRMLGMFVYLTGAWLLALSVLKDPRLIFFFMALVLVSRYPFLWLSSELFAGGLLCAAIAVLNKRSRPLAGGILLGLAGLSKPDIILTSMVLVAVCLFLSRDRPQYNIKIVCAFFLTLTLMILPGIIQHGASYISPDVEPGSHSRSFFSFGQHYAALKSEPQQIPDKNPWLSWESYMAEDFPNAHSVKDVVFKHTGTYLAFVGKSAQRGASNFLLTFHVLTLALVFAWMARSEFRADRAMVLIGWTLIGMLPLVLLSYPHVRYFARWLPLVLIFLMFCYRELAKKTDDRRITMLRRGVLGSLILYFLCSVILIIGDYQQWVLGETYWFPD